MVLRRQCRFRNVTNKHVLGSAYDVSFTSNSLFCKPIVEPVFIKCRVLSTIYLKGQWKVTKILSQDSRQISEGGISYYRAGVRII